MKQIVLLTSSELRHDFVRKALGLADGISVLRSYCEGLDGTTVDKVRNSDSDIKAGHLRARARSEHDFFSPFVELTEDESDPVEIERGEINDPNHYEEIIDLDPDLLVAYGCSIIDSPLLSAFEKRFLSVHLGLSPYYRGTGTNFWPLVNGEPEYVGATFMHLDEGVDTGDIIHQIRARIHPNDSPHQIGNRLIADMTVTYIELIRQFEELKFPMEEPKAEDSKYYERDDYSEGATEQLYENFEAGLVEQYLSERDERIDETPIVRNAGFDEPERVSRELFNL